MSFILFFQPDETVSIGDAHFEIQWEPPALIGADQQIVTVTETPQSLMPGVTVGLATWQHPGLLGIAFTAPRGLLILRHRNGARP